MAASLGRLTARICKHGHVIEDDHGKEVIRVRVPSGPIVTVTSNNMSAPPNGGNFCSKCGEEVLSHCEHCSKSIPGIQAQTQGVPYVRRKGDYERPAYCEYCGTPYPWTIFVLNEIGRLLEQGIDEGSLNAQEIAVATGTSPKEAIRGAVIEVQNKGTGATTAWRFLQGVAEKVAAGEVSDRLHEIVITLGDWFQ